jgi:hypothetical protein
MAEMASGQITIEISGGRRSGKTATALRLLAEDSRRWLVARNLGDYYEALAAKLGIPWPAIRERIVVSDAQLHGRDVSAVIYDLE